MKYLLTIIAIVSSTFISTAQVDTWMEKLKTLKGREKVDLLNKVAEAYTEESAPLKAKTYLEESISLSKSLKYKDGLAVAYYFMGEVFNLQSDMKKAEKYLIKWCKIREKQGDKLKLGWALNGMARFYAAQLNDKKTEKFYLKFLKLNRQMKSQYGEIAVLQRLAFYYHYGASTTSQRPTNVKKAIYYYDAFFQKFRAVYGKERCPLSEVDFYFKTLIDKAIEKKHYKQADKLAAQWFAFVKKFDGDFQSSIRIRQIAKAFYEVSDYTKTAEYIEKAVNFMQKIGTHKQKLRALRHGCFMMRRTKHYLKALTYAIDIWKIEKSEGKINEWYTFSTLNAAVAKIFYTSDNQLKADAIQQLKEWKSTLYEDVDTKPIKWVNENIEILKL